MFHTQEIHGERQRKGEKKKIRSHYRQAHHIQANVKRGTNRSDGISTVSVMQYALPRGRFSAQIFSSQLRCTVAPSPDYKQLNIVMQHQFGFISNFY